MPTFSTSRTNAAGAKRPWEAPVVEALAIRATANTRFGRNLARSIAAYPYLNPYFEPFIADRVEARVPKTEMRRG